MMKSAIFLTLAFVAIQASAEKYEWSADRDALSRLNVVIKDCPKAFAKAVKNQNILALSGASEYGDGEGTETFVLKTGQYGQPWLGSRPTVTSILTVTKARAPGPQPTDAPARYDVDCDLKKVNEPLFPGTR
jgi:hypothetical protein